MFGVVFIPEDEMWFPDPRLARGRDLIAFGGDLSVERLVLAYKSGLFPWTADPPTWWSPDPRAILPFENLHISKSLKKFLRKEPFTITVDKAFEEVINLCASTRPEGTWISQKFIKAYTDLHYAGHAHSLECWQADKLVGGIYGVSIGGYFSAESMFHLVNNASKVALVKLVNHLQVRGYTLLDIQMLTNITKQMGGILIRREEFLDKLNNAIKLKCSFI